MRVRHSLALGAVLAFAGTGTALGSPTITEHPLLSSDRGPQGIAAGPDQNLWFAEGAGPGGIGRITTSGSVSEFTSGISGPAEDITAGPDGNLWFTEPGHEKVGSITTGGTITEFATPKPSQPQDIVAGSDGNLWFTVGNNPGGIGRVTPEGTITIFTIGLTPNSKPTGIAAGPDGALWFTESANPGRIGRITTTGTITEFSTGLTPNGEPKGIAAGPDGALWFTERAGSGRIGRITTAGAITEYSAGLTGNSQPEAIAAADDGSLYFTEFKDPGRIGRITTTGAITEYATPTNPSKPTGIAAGPDGNVWFGEEGNHGQIGRITVAPGVGAAGASALSEQTATLEAPVRANAQASTYFFEYGTTSAFGATTTPASAGSGSVSTPVSAGLSGLTAGTTYHIRAVATNASGTTYGPEASFTTASPPAATTSPASSVTLTSALLHGLIDPESRATTYHFEWGPTTAYGHTAPEPDGVVGSDASEHAVEHELNGLAPDTEYHYRVVASNCGGCAEGTSYGTDQSFTTAPTPTAATGEAVEVGETSALLRGTIGPRGAATTFHFDWGETTSYGDRSPASDALAGSDNEVHAASTQLTSLRAGTVYHYRVVASNCGGCLAGTSYGEDRTFTSLPKPAPVLAPSGLARFPVAPLPLAAPSSPSPTLGRSAVVHVAAGHVLVRTPGSRTAASLGPASTIPVGSLIDATHGTLVLSTEVNDSGVTQSATLWGTSFRVGQSARPPGMTTLTLAGPGTCTRARGTRDGLGWAASHIARRSPQGLWAKDNRGHFSTRGQTSVATVRGTYWYTAEQCDGTLTSVKQGVVAVRDLRRHRTVVLRAGRSYLAKR